MNAKPTLSQKPLPKWFDGQIYNEGDTVTNPYTDQSIKLTAEEQAVIDNPIDFTPSGVTRDLQPYNPDTGENLIKTIFDERFQDPTTGDFFEEADLTYRSDVNEAGEPLPVFQPYSAELSDAKKYLVKQAKCDRLGARGWA